MNQLTVQIVICILVGYLFGNLQTGIVVGNAMHVDIRKHGSGNTGTTNALRTLGLKAGFLTFLGDFFKAFVPTSLVKYVIFSELPQTELLVILTGLGVIVGHNFPFWLKFKGGKGIASSSGTMIAFDPLFIPFGLTSFFVPVLITRYVSLGSLILSTVFVVFVGITRWGDPYFAGIFACSVIMMLLAFYRHHANIMRLMNGTENKVTIGKKDDHERDC